MSPTKAEPPRVILCTLNAKYVHASLGLRYLMANMGPLRDETVVREYTLSRRTEDMARDLLDLLGVVLSHQVQVIGFGVYIWNVAQTCALVRQLKLWRPGLKIVLGGPEVSHEWDSQEIVALADHVITGWGDLSFARLCQALLHGPRPLMKLIAGEQPPLDAIALPYAQYTDADLAHRVVYVEASRGCPFKCAFCLSSLDKTAWAFDLPRFLAALVGLYQRGARNFKFVDRTFNLKIDASVRILQFFLDRVSAPGAAADGAGLFVHFEVIPDHLPERLKQMIACFPAGVLQFEVGIQTFNTTVQSRISRVQDNDRTAANVQWLVQESRAHVHADLIFGLPGESMASFACGFDRLLALGPHEIQLGVLKRLRGTRVGDTPGHVFDLQPPYTVQETADVSAADLQRFTRLARYWDLIANSGRFRQTLPMLLLADAARGAAGPSPFAAWMRLSDWLWARTGATHRLTPEQLVDVLYAYLVDHSGADASVVAQTLRADYLASGARGRPQCLRHLLAAGTTPVKLRIQPSLPRQTQHLAALPDDLATTVKRNTAGMENRL